MTTMDDERLRAELYNLALREGMDPETLRAELYNLALREGMDPETLYAAWLDGDPEAEAVGEVIALRARAERAERDASGYLADHSAALLDLGAIRDAARAHLAADDALSVARRTDAADVPTAEARALAARDTLAGLVGYVGEVGR